MAQILAAGTGATEAAVWIEEGGRLRMDTSWPRDAGGLADAADIGEIEAAGADLAVPVRHGGEVLGALSIRKRSGEPVTATERALVDHLASQAGLVLRNVRLIEELRASRRRIVAAQDERAKARALREPQDAFQTPERWVPLSPLDRANVSPVEASFVAEGLLRQSCPFPERAKDAPQSGEVGGCWARAQVAPADDFGSTDYEWRCR